MKVAIQLISVLAVLSITFSGPAIAFYFLMYFKNRARAARKSPLTNDLLRAAGHGLREKMEDVRMDLLSTLLFLMVAPLILIALYFAQVHIASVEFGMGAISTCVLGGIGVLVWGIIRLLKQSRQLDVLRLGLDAELAVGQELDQLMRQGAYVFHDFPARDFNIDHVVISRQGVFAVETKGYSKPNSGQGKKYASVIFNGSVLQFPNWQVTEPLIQAERQAAWLGKWLSKAHGASIAVTPILALPGWWVDRTGRGRVSVFSGRELSGLFRSFRAQVLSDQQVQQIAHAVEGKCRNVRPSYREHED